jgi:hypothetical protein
MTLTVYNYLTTLALVFGKVSQKYFYNKQQNNTFQKNGLIVDENKKVFQNDTERFIV